MNYGPTEGWSDAMIMALTRDTRCWVTHDHEGNEIGDWTDTKQYLLMLYSIARHCCWYDPTRPTPTFPPTCLEIGTRHGISTLAILQACKETGGRLTSLEIDENFAGVARERVEAAGLSQWWDLQVVDCNEYVSHVGKLDFVFIDGDHSYAQCKRDVENYGSKIRLGGYILMHDTQNTVEPGPAQVIEEMRTTGRYEILRCDWSYGLGICKVIA